MKPRLVFLSNIAAPYQVKFCDALQAHFETEFWFYEQLTDRRPTWWKVPLGERCKVLSDSIYTSRLNYVSLNVFKELYRFKPDVLLLGGFTPFHALLLRYARWLGMKVVILSEPIRIVDDEDAGSDKLLTRASGPKKTQLFRAMFRDADLIFGMGQVARDQFVDEFGFRADQVVNAPYPIDIEAYFDHPLRLKRPNDPVRILFANRLVERYQPLVALEAYRQLKADYPHVSLALNRDGHLYEACRAFIATHGLEDVTFLDQTESWDDLHLVYRDSDILVLPATYSNGNLTIVEACASGMGVIVSHHVDNVARHLQEGENCFKCEPTAASLAASLRRYLDDPRLLWIHGAVSKQNVDHRRNTATAATYRDFIQSIISSDDKGEQYHGQAHAARRSDASSASHLESERKGNLHDPMRLPTGQSGS